MIELGRHIEHLLLQSDCVIVPSLGGFVASHIPAWYDDNDNMFIPPYRTLGFNPKLNLNDSLLAQSYTETYDISYPEACNRIEREVEELKQHIANNGSYELNDIGTLFINDDGNIEFTPCEAGILTPSLYSFSSFEMNTLKQVEEDKHEATVSTVPQRTTLNTTLSGKHENIDNDNANIADIKSIKINAVRNLVAAVIAVFLFFVLGTPVNENDNVITSNMGGGLFPQLIQNEYGSTKRTSDRPNLPVQKNTANKTVTNKQISNSDHAKNVQVTNKTIERSNKPYFCLVLASKVTETNAQSFVDKLKRKGLNDAKVLKENNKSTKVIYGHYTTQNEAFNSLNNLRDTEEFFDAWVYQVNE